MILKSTLKEIVTRQREDILDGDPGVERDVLDSLDMDSTHAVVISGIRRCGKSTLLKQISRRLSNYYYFNFEDQKAMNFEVSDFEKLNSLFSELNGPCKYYLFDEVQNVVGWERFVRTMQDKGMKFVITGSNASLLSRELGTRLTGRHIVTELFPFSFGEMQRFIGEQASDTSFQTYARKGGFPEFLRFGDERLLQQLLSDIIMRDIVVRHGLRNSKQINSLALYLLSNVGKEFSYNRLKETFQLGSTTTVISYVSYLEDSYLLFTVPKFDYSYYKQQVNRKKVFAVDIGLVKANSVSLSQDEGRMLENLVFLDLRRRHKEIFYFREKSECDFLVREKDKITQAVQVCSSLDSDNMERELRGLREAMAQFKLKKGVIVTENQEDRFGDVEVVPAWKWLSKP